MADINLFAGEEDLFRKCIIFYATISAKEVNKNFDTSAIDSLVFSKIKSDLFPVLAVKDKFDLEGKKQQAKEYVAIKNVFTNASPIFENAESTVNTGLAEITTHI
ncbi:hypothetical protein SAMN05216390_13128 [Lachnospiraceae bacterium KH1T2]|nr:hypothetical protein SAMN05216390_13128 [Lachnospiraceae bacterium KH1T2]